MRTTAFLLFLVTAAAQGVSFDVQGFGGRLNGWRKDRSAVYSLTDGSYRTLVPTITGTPAGGMFLSTQIDYIIGRGAAAVCHLDLTFNSSGTLQGAQIRGLIEGKSLDTGMVRRPQPRPAVEGEPAPAPLPGDPTSEMIVELFTKFDAEFKKVSEAKGGEVKRDLFSRFGGAGTPRAANVAAGVRHNFNLIMQHVTAHGSPDAIAQPGVSAPCNGSYYRESGTAGRSAARNSPSLKLGR